MCITRQDCIVDECDCLPFLEFFWGAPLVAEDGEMTGESGLRLKRYTSKAPHPRKQSKTHGYLRFPNTTEPYTIEPTVLPFNRLISPSVAVYHALN